MTQAAGGDVAAQLRRLLEVQKMDRRRDELEANLRRVRAGEEIAAARARLKELERELEARRRTLQELRRKVRWGEGEGAELERQIKDFERQLYGGKVRNPKELEAIQARIAELKQKLSGVSDETLVAMEEAELLEPEATELEDRIAAQEAEIASLERRRTEEAAQLEAQISSVPPVRDPLAAAVDPALLREYESIRARRGGIGVALMANRVCGACRTSVPIMVAKAAEGGGKVKCEHCGRLLVPAE